MFLSTQEPGQGFGLDWPRLIAVAPPAGKVPSAPSRGCRLRGPLNRRSGQDGDTGPNNAAPRRIHHAFPALLPRSTIVPLEYASLHREIGPEFPNGSAT